MIGFKETACTSCSHREVCKNKEQFLKAQEAADDVTVHLGEGRMIRLRDIPWISAVDLQCEHYLKEIQGGTIR